MRIRGDGLPKILFEGVGAPLERSSKGQSLRFPCFSCIFHDKTTGTVTVTVTITVTVAVSLQEGWSCGYQPFQYIPAPPPPPPNKQVGAKFFRHSC